MVTSMRVLRTALLTGLPLLVGVLPARAALATLPGPPALQASPSPSVMNAPGLEAALIHAAPTMRPEALRSALAAWNTLVARGEIARPLLTVIDYGLPSMIKRMWVFDLASRKLLFHELVAHGQNSGEDLTEFFSNEEGSLKTSLGAFVTGETYIGRNGYSMRLRGMDPGLNDQAEMRTIVVHGAPYVDLAVAHKLGRLGRSHGCPAVRPGIARAFIDRVKNRTLLYAWHPLMTIPSSPDETAGETGTVLDVRSRRGR